jgi:hypothetical protein
VGLKAEDFCARSFEARVEAHHIRLPTPPQDELRHEIERLLQSGGKLREPACPLGRSKMVRHAVQIGPPGRWYCCLLPC